MDSCLWPLSNHFKGFSWAVAENNLQMSCLVTKPTKWLCAQRRLRSAWAFAQSDQSSLCAHWVGKDPSFLHADSEDSDQTGRMLRLIWVFTRRTCHFVGFVMRCLINNFVVLLTKACCMGVVLLLRWYAEKLSEMFWTWIFCYMMCYNSSKVTWHKIV